MTVRTQNLHAHVPPRIAIQSCGHHFTSQPPQPAYLRLGIILSKEMIAQWLYKLVESRRSDPCVVDGAQAEAASTTPTTHHKPPLDMIVRECPPPFLHNHHTLLVLNRTLGTTIHRYQMWRQIMGRNDHLRLPYPKNSQI